MAVVVEVMMTLVVMCCGKFRGIGVIVLTACQSRSAYRLSATLEHMSTE
jgi:hypothetical protein